MTLAKVKTNKKTIMKRILDLYDLFTYLEKDVISIQKKLGIEGNTIRASRSKSKIRQTKPVHYDFSESSSSDTSSESDSSYSTDSEIKVHVNKRKPKISIASRKK